MPVLSSPSTLRDRPPSPKLGGGGRPPVSGSRGFGGGDGGRDDAYPDFGEQLRRYRLGMMIGLAAVVMIFVSFTTAYLLREQLGVLDPATGRYVSDWKPVPLPLGLLLINTGLLLASSFTIEKARRAALQRAAVIPITSLPGIAADKRRQPWLGITVLLGLLFLGGQLLAWREVARRGFYPAAGPSSSFFYVLTGAHALHLLGGLLALIYASLAVFRSRALERRRIIIDVTAWYWHFMAFLWLYLFALLKFT